MRHLPWAQNSVTFSAAKFVHGKPHWRPRGDKIDLEVRGLKPNGQESTTFLIGCIVQVFLRAEAVSHNDNATIWNSWLLNWAPADFQAALRKADNDNYLNAPYVRSPLPCSFEIGSQFQTAHMCIKLKSTTWSLLYLMNQNNRTKNGTVVVPNSRTIVTDFWGYGTFPASSELIVES